MLLGEELCEAATHQYAIAALERFPEPVEHGIELRLRNDALLRHLDSGMPSGHQIVAQEQFLGSKTSPTA